MPPPTGAALPARVESLTFRVPRLSMPPPPPGFGLVPRPVTVPTVVTALLTSVELVSRQGAGVVDGAAAAPVGGIRGRIARERRALRIRVPALSMAPP